jgi:hypothetical protein
MKVKELIEELSKMDPEAECYRGSFEGFLNDDMKHATTITDKQLHTVYPLEVEFMTVFDWDHRKGKWVTYTGAIFE